MYDEVKSFCFRVIEARQGPYDGGMQNFKK
jgi:hypothetical protein